MCVFSHAAKAERLCFPASEPVPVGGGGPAEHGDGESCCGSLADYGEKIRELRGEELERTFEVISAKKLEAVAPARVAEQIGAFGEAAHWVRVVPSEMLAD